MSDSSTTPRSVSTPNCTSVGRCLVAVLVVGSMACSSAPTNRATQAAAPSPAPNGIVVMAHGGEPGWNTAIEALVEPIRDSVPTAVAFGMADRATLADAVGKLEERGVRRIAVVRLFVSAESFLEQTEYLLGLREEPPAQPTYHGHGNNGPHAPIPIEADLALSAHGLSESPLVGEILADRVRDLSRDPSRESVLLLAHGMGDDSANARLHENLERRADQVRAAGRFRQVRVETLREDWADDREVAEDRIRAFVKQARANDGIALVVPVRVSGFGPYASVLEGHVYRHDGRGLSPHPLLTEWIRQQAAATLAAMRR